MAGNIVRGTARYLERAMRTGRRVAAGAYRNPKATASRLFNPNLAKANAKDGVAAGKTIYREWRGNRNHKQAGKAIRDAILKKDGALDRGLDYFGASDVTSGGWDRAGTAYARMLGGAAMFGVGIAAADFLNPFGFGSISD